MEDKDTLPVGLHTWLAANNTCNLGQTNTIQLQLSACLPHQFTCSSGKCISLDNRCDNREVSSFFLLPSYLSSTPSPFIVTSLFQDCDDSSDEKNCRTVSFDEQKYLKNKPPPPAVGIDKLQITPRCKDLCCC